MMLKLQDITKTYVSPDGLETQVLRGVDLEVAAGESVAIVGPSGSGKSTLLHIAGTLDRPTNGSVAINGVDGLEKDDRQLADLRANEIGFVFQKHHLLPQCTVLENVLVPSIVSQDNAGTEDRARSLIERVGLTGRIGNRPGQLSGGECQRVAVARALINRPRLLLADEPTGALDAGSSEKLTELLVELNKEQNTALVVVTHAEPLADRMTRRYVLRNGQLEGELQTMGRRK